MLQDAVLNDREYERLEKILNWEPGKMQSCYVDSCQGRHVSEFTVDELEQILGNVEDALSCAGDSADYITAESGSFFIEWYLPNNWDAMSQSRRSTITRTRYAILSKIFQESAIDLIELDIRDLIS